MCQRVASCVDIFLLLPVLVVVDDNLSVFVAAVTRGFPSVVMLDAAVELVLGVSPCVLDKLLFTNLCICVPGARIHFQRTVLPKFVTKTTFRVLRCFCVRSRV